MQILPTFQKSSRSQGSHLVYPLSDEAYSSISRQPSDLDAGQERQSLNQAKNLIAELEERIRQLEGLAMTDPLTGALNRRGFSLSLNRELGQSRRENSAFGLLMLIDLDGFKSINDRYGHSAGDFYLREVVRSLQALVRSHDLVARIGGDEFAIILTRISRKDADIRRREIERDFNCHVTEWNNIALPLKGSFGSVYYDGKRTVEDVMVEADHILYKNKKSKTI